LITRQKAIHFLRDVGCPANVIEHCLSVERVASKIAEKIRANRHRIDIEVVRIGALLHDVGRAQTHNIEHGVRGGEILRSNGLGEFAKFAENHIGAGIPAEEAKELGLPNRDFIPRSLEEKVVAYADKLVEGKRVVPYAKAVERFKRELGDGHPALERFERLHEEIRRLTRKGDPSCTGS